MLDKIVELRKLRAEKETVARRASELEQPVLTDLSLVPTLYGWFREILAGMPRPPGQDSVGQRRKFLFVVIMLYSPKTFCGEVTRAGLCGELSKIFSLTHATVSRNISDMVFFYENYRDYADSAEEIYREILKRI